jgi:ADP-ribosylglycohydrolase
VINHLKRLSFKQLNIMFTQRTLDALKCCAVGDALGAGVENWKLAEILSYFSSPENLEYTRVARPNKPVTNGQAGDVTDDTAMTLCVMSSLTKTMKEFLHHQSSTVFSAENFQLCAVQHMHQAFLYWGLHQQTYSGVSGRACAPFITDHDWSDLDPLLDTHGAGDGTMNVLTQGIMGTLQHLPERKAPGDAVPQARYVDGCGALMRVLPVGLICGVVPGLDPFVFGCQSGAITHGDAASYLSAGLFAALITDLLRRPRKLSEALTEIKLQLNLKKNHAKSELESTGYTQCLQAITTAMDQVNDSGIYPVDHVDQIGNLCGGKFFKTPPILAQALFITLAAEKHGWHADTALKLAATQSGDSDSVAAIAGSLLGVMGGNQARLSDKLYDGLNKRHRYALEQVAEKFLRTLDDFLSHLKLTQAAGKSLRSNGK